MKCLNDIINEAKKDVKTFGKTILDGVLNGDIDNAKEFTSFIKPNGPIIYAFTTNKVKDAIKIGYTDQHPDKRIAQWAEIYGKEPGDVVTLGYWSAEELDKAGERVFFWDHAVHNKVAKAGFLNVKKEEFEQFLSDEGKKLITVHYSKEFFRKYKTLFTGEQTTDALTKELLADIITQMRQNIKNGTADFKTYKFSVNGKTTTEQGNKYWGAPSSYSTTDLQDEAIRNGLNAIKDGKKNLLMAAVMRFGKTHTSYEIVKQAGLKKVIVTSGKADVRKAWRDGINHVHFVNDFVFIEVIDKYKWDISYKKDNVVITESRNIYDDSDIINDFLKANKTIILFATLQDLSGSIGALKAKHKGLFNSKYDMLIIDETHYGSHSSKWGEVSGVNAEEISQDDIDDAKAEIAQLTADEKAMNNLNIKYTTLLQVSGTPYYILASNEMLKKDSAIISKVSYTDMVRARDKWEFDNKGKDRSQSPYFGVPTLHKIGLQLPKECQKAIADAGMTASISALFKTSKDGKKFVYEKAIKNLMRALFGNGRSDKMNFLDNKTVKGNKVCKHTLIRMPNIKSCELMKELLNKLLDTNARRVINVVGGNKDVNSISDLNRMLTELDNQDKRSIVLSVNRFMTGVSMPLLDSMIYLRDSSSPQDYDQSIFRLCTRNVRKVEDPEEGMQKRINMKENVYLIDFNITNMMNMIANSARMKAAADGSADAERISKYIEDDITTTSIFAEKGDEIGVKMHQMTVKDMLEIYAKYNSNKSIADIANDDINIFIGLFQDKNFQQLINRFNVKADNSINVIGIDDTTVTTDISLAGMTDKKQMQTLRDTVKTALSGMTKDEKKKYEETQKKFKSIVKMLMYCNLCLDKPYTDMESIIEGAKTDAEFSKMLKSFNINITDLKAIYNYMGVQYKQLFNQMLLKISLLANDVSKGDHEKFMTGVAGLGRIGKAEVITPKKIVEKMIAKLPDSMYKNAKSILLVNEKQGEFFAELCKKLGNKAAVEKCKIVASSETTRYLIIKLLKTMGLSEYINTVLVNIEDQDGNGQYDINDFLKMSNTDILKMNGGKKFDVVLMNPPYSNKEQFLDMNFVSKINDICKTQIVIHPAKKWVSNTKLGKSNAESKHLKSLEILNANDVFDINTEWKYAGIFEYDNVKEYTTYDVIFNGNITQMEYNDLSKRNDFYKTLDFSKNLTDIINIKESLYKDLIKKYKTMVNDGHGFIYEETDLKRGEKRYSIKKNDNIGLTWERRNHYRKWLKDGVYKYCLYKGSFNHSYDEVQEWKGQDPETLFNGQILWLTNSETVKNNIKYWMECPLFDLWRLYKLKLRPRNNIVSGCAYGELPALDFEMNESKFREYVNSLNDFTKDEIEILKSNNIHNADKL